MTEVCHQCKNKFEILPEDLAFYEKFSPIFANKKYPLSPPTLCPACREQRRWAVRSERKLYKRNCDFTGEEMISLYSSDKPYTVYKEDIWQSDKWNPLDYGRDFDFSQSFFDQFRDLQLAVPRRGMHQSGDNENCEYITFGMANKNCYLVFSCIYSEDTYYSAGCLMGKNLMECFYCIQCQLSYECIGCTKCYECFFCDNCVSCEDSYLLEDCKNCRHCIGCKNLRNKEYYIYNKPVSKEEFEKKKAELQGENLLKEKEKFDQWKLSLPYCYCNIVQSENSSGDHLENAKNCYQCFSILLGAEDCRYCQSCGWKGKDMMDCILAGKESELLYESVSTVTGYQCAFVNFNHASSNTYYSDNITNCQNCFGCIGLTHKQYCILNKQYSKEEYEKLVPKIIEHMQKTKEWGEFFPISLSPFCYNETLAQDFYPLTKEEVLAKGWQWKDKDQKNFQPATYRIPSTIQEVPETVTKEILACRQCGKNYKIIPQELAFYRKYKLKIPDNCWECRYKRRLLTLKPHKLWQRNCAKCGVTIQTSYAPERPASPLSGGSRSGGKIIYCEPCYLQEMY